MNPRAIAFILGAALFIVSWFLLVAPHGVTIPRDMRGWGAFQFAVMAVWDGARSSETAWYVTARDSLSPATNLVMIAALALSWRPRRHDRAVGLALIAAFLVNAQWVVLSDTRWELGAGYFSWWFSFLIVGFSLLFVKRGSARTS